MTLTIVILLLLTAIALILVEIFLIPGVGIPGLLGLVLLCISLFSAYSIDTTTGHLTLAASVIASGGLMALAFQAKTWTKMSVQNEITSRVIIDTSKLEIGQEGKTQTRLNPIGNVLFGDQQIEARSKGEFIDDHTTVEIVNIEGNKITVKPKIN
jgi:membrane-bound ClpP family serine protease